MQSQVVFTVRPDGSVDFKIEPAPESMSRFNGQLADWIDDTLRDAGVIGGKLTNEQRLWILGLLDDATLRTASEWGLNDTEVADTIWNIGKANQLEINRMINGKDHS